MEEVLTPKLETLAFRPRIGVRLDRPVTDGLLHEFPVRPAFPAANSPCVHQVPWFRIDGHGATTRLVAHPPHHTVPPNGLDGYGWVELPSSSLSDLDAAVDRLRAHPEVELVWIEMPPAPSPADPDPATRVTDTAALDAEYQAGLDALHRAGAGRGVHLAIVERAWGPVAEKRFGVPGERGCHPATPWASHGNATVSIVKGTAQVPGIAPDASVHLFSTLELDGGVWVDRVPEALQRAVDRLSVEMPRGGGILLIEMQQYLTRRQVFHLGTFDDTDCPGGRAALGPVEADPAVLSVILRAVALGHTVVVPAGNGRIDRIENAWTNDFSTVLGRLPRAALRVGASHRGQPTMMSNRGRWVDLYAPGHQVRAAEDDALTGLVRRDGTSVAAAIIAGTVACLQSAHLRTGAALDPVAMRNELLAVHGTGARALGLVPNGGGRRRIPRTRGPCPR
ncbi:MAG: S8 family serine peptidase, partial [Myxococcota bacterium]